MHLYLAGDLVPAHEERRGPDVDEHLELEHVPWRAAVAMAERGEIADAKSLVGILRAARIQEAAGRRGTEAAPPAGQSVGGRAGSGPRRASAPR